MIENIYTFAITIMILSITPGPCMTLSLNTGLTMGVKKANLTGLGDYIGLFIYTVISAVGVGAIISNYPNVIKFIQYGGGLYIIYLGIMAMRSKIDIKQQKIAVFSDLQLVKIGFITLISNPKAILFYTAFFPQFLDPNKPLFIQLAIMIPIVIGAEIISINVYAVGGKTLSLFLKETKIIQYISGSLLIFVGFWLGFK